MEWLLRKDNPVQLRLFRWLAGLQVILLFVIMASALQRMRLYQNEFGLTELRLYTTAFMGWLAVVFAWFMVTVLPGRRERFAFGRWWPVSFRSLFCTSSTRTTSLPYQPGKSCRRSEP